MSKDNKIPTKLQFEKIIDPIINTKVIEPRIGPPKPILPDYLKEIVIKGNPFTKIKNDRISELNKSENERKMFDNKMVRDFPLYQNVSRSIKNKYNAEYKVRKLKYNMDMEEIKSKRNVNVGIVEKKPDKTKFISNTDYVVDRRRICLLDLAIDIKEEEFLKLNEIILQEEQLIKLEEERLEKEQEAHHLYLKNICQKTSDALKLAEKKTLKKNTVIEKVKRSRYNMAHINAECVKLEEEYLRLKTYKEFLRTCYNQSVSQQSFERSSFMDELKLDFKLSDDFLGGNSNDDSYDLKKPKTKSNKSKKKSKVENDNFNDTAVSLVGSKNNSNNNEIDMAFESNMNDTETNKTLKNTIFNKNQLERLKEVIVLGFSNTSNKSEYSDINEVIESGTKNKNNKEHHFDEDDFKENDLFFKSPQDLVDLLSELECNNLSLIENVQEQEEICDHLKSKIRKIKEDMKSQKIMIDDHVAQEETRINKMEDSLNCFKEMDQYLLRFNNLERYKKMFNFGDLEVTTPDELLDYLHEKISTLYHSVFEKVDSTKSNTVEMLKRIESLIDSLYLEIQSYDRSVILKAKREVDERKREASRLRQKQLSKEAEAQKLERAMIKIQMPPRYRYGRKVVSRSDKPKPILTIEVIDLEELRKQEEHLFFFT